MSRGIFITGTDTGIGKTHVTAALLTELRRRGISAAAFKPIACGKGGRHDAEIYAAIMNHEQPFDVINPIYLRHPLAPSVAAELEHKRIDLRKILRTYQQLAANYDVVLVEGAGGLLVPIREDYFVADLAKTLKLPLLIVARLGLGTINHTLLTVRQANAHGLKIAGLVLNNTAGSRRGLAERTNIRALPKLCNVPLLGVMPHGKKALPTVAHRICDRLFSERLTVVVNVCAQ
jgi:dethiobiotin synthetase